MQSSADKRRDMARSILPSRYRSPGKMITKAKRSNRRDIRAGLRSITRDADPTNDDWDERVDFRAYPDAEIGRQVSWRRAGDKLAHFERWAIAVTRDFPIHDRLSHLRSTLPNGLIGDHAMSHLRRRRELNPTAEFSRWTPEERDRRRHERRAAECFRRRRLSRAVRLALEHGHHKELNAVLKRCGPDDPDPILVCDGDTDAFVTALVARTQLGAMLHRLAVERLTAYLETEGFLGRGEVVFPTQFAGDAYW